MIEISDISLFFREGITEVATYVIYIGMIYILKILFEKKSRYRSIMVALVVIFVFTWNICFMERKLELFETSLFAGMLVLILKVVNILELDLQNLIFIFCAFLIPKRLFNSSFSIWGDGLFYLVIWGVLILFRKKESKEVLGRYLMLTYLALCSFLYFRVNYALMDIESVIYALLDAVTVFGLIIVTYLLARKWRIQLTQFGVLEKKYASMADWSFIFEIISVLTFILLPIPFVLTGSVTESQRNIVSLINIGILLIELVYMVCLYHITKYKTTSFEMKRLIEEDNEYRRSLDDNLEQMANIRHDMKNIFLTMEHFVERSNDEEMKLFYREKISPFANKEIKQNYFLAQLQQIPSEMLRAFFYTKLREIIALDIEVRLTILVDQEQFQYGIETVDLIRICGILIDNAREECMGVPGAQIDISVKTNENEVAYSIKNTVREGHDFRKMLEGKSDKEGHKGRGIKIVNAIIEGYPQAVLSTYHDDAIFWQTLKIQR